MSYRNGRDVLPPELLALVQQYVQGESLYIPRKDARSCAPKDAALRERNRCICRAYADGESVKQLAQRYFLSTQAIYKILSGKR